MPKDVRSVTPNNGGAPTCNEAVLSHLGRILAQTCSPDHNEAAISSRLTALIEKLSAALTLSDNRDAAEFRSGLLEASPALLRFANSLTRDPSDADDLIQDTLLRAWRSQDKFAAGTNISAWLFTIMRNSFYSKYRKKRFEIIDSDDESLANLVSLPEQAGIVDLADVQKAMARLPAAMREALILVTIESLSYEEAASVMDCKIGTVKSRVWRAREELVQLLGFGKAEIGNGSDTFGAIV